MTIIDRLRAAWDALTAPEKDPQEDHRYGIVIPAIWQIPTR